MMQFRRSLQMQDLPINLVAVLDEMPIGVCLASKSTGLS